MEESLQQVKIPSSRLVVPVLGGHPSPYLGNWLHCFQQIHWLIPWPFPASYLSRSFFRLYSWSNLQNVVIKKDRNLYSLQFNENVKIRLQMSLKQQRRQPKTKSLISTKKETCKTGLFQHNNVTTMRPFARSLRTTTLLANNTQHCWMSCCVRLHNLLNVVAQSLKQAKLLATCKRSCWLTMLRPFAGGLTVHFRK